MKQKTELRAMLWFTLGYLVLFTIIAILNQNYEFLYYSFVMAGMILLVVLYYKKIHLSTHILLGLTIVGALHIFGGNIFVGGTRLYDLWLIPSLFRYDNLVHSLAIFLITLISYSILHFHLDKKINHNPYTLSILLILIALGAGALNEIIELGAVLFLNAAQGVGDYLNNAKDLFFNLVGSVLACAVIIQYHKRTFFRGKK